jgi:hypothetical protein
MVVHPKNYRRNALIAVDRDSLFGRVTGHLPSQDFTFPINALIRTWPVLAAGKVANKRMASFKPKAIPAASYYRQREAPHESA